MSTNTITMWRLMHDTIMPVQCSKVTACYVWPADDCWRGKESRRSSHQSYHETWADAHTAMLQKAELKLAAAGSELVRARRDYDRVKGMKPPADQLADYLERRFPSEH